MDSNEVVIMEGNKGAISSKLIKGDTLTKDINLNHILLSSNTECSSRLTVDSLCTNSSSTNRSLLCMVSPVCPCLLRKHLLGDQLQRQMGLYTITIKTLGRRNGISRLACLKSGKGVWGLFDSKDTFACMND
jgi:hypothetical protein